jgi:hypothetical protein
MKTPKLRSRDDFLELLDADDVVQLWKRWQLPQLPKDVMPRSDSVEFRDAVERLSITTLVQEVLSIKSDTVTMLRDIIVCLSAFFTTLRTTGGLLVLDEEFGLGPQEIEATLQWSERSLKRQGASTWDRLLQEFVQEVKPFLERLASAADVSFRFEWVPRDIVKGYREDPFHTHLNRLARQPPPPKKIQIATWNADAVELCKIHEHQLSRLVKNLTSLPEDRFSAEVAPLVAALRATLHRLGKAANPYANSGRADDRRLSSSRYTIASADRERWRRFQEEVLFLADIEESSGFADLLRLDLFRKRPQLYEVWCLTLLLDFFRRSGYRVELESTAINEVGRPVWTLNYAKSRQPIGKIENPLSGQRFWLFYQLIRKGNKRDEMPDIALLPSPDPDDQPVWIMDPKHSERCGYSTSDYQRVAQRYHAAFHPRETWIVEYYPRSEISRDPAFSFGEGVELLLGVSPAGDGATVLKARLRQIHPPCPVTLAIVDVSSSFADSLDRVQADLRALLDAGVLLSDEAVVFAETARLVPTSSVSATKIEGIVGGGTRFRPVLDLLTEVEAKGGGLTTVRLYTDGQFSDISLAEAQELLSSRCKVVLAELG